MSLELKINEDIKAAMMARDAEKLEAIRAVKAALLLEKTKEGATPDVGEEVEIRILQKLVKQRRESADIYTKANRADLAQKEIFEASVIEAYLPKQMEEAEVGEIIRKIISQTGATSIRDMGTVMGAASKELAGKADGKMISGIVKNLLSGAL